MRYLLNAAIVAAAVLIAAPAAAQVGAPGPVYHNQSGAPIPNAPMAGPRFNPPPVQTGGPVYHNQSGAPMPGAPYSAPQGEPQMRGPQRGPVRAGPQRPDDGRVFQNGRWVSMPAPGPIPGARHGNRWGGQVSGRWWGGSQAPGGWGGYRRPRRGASIDSYWMRPDFRIPDYLSFGLSAPPYGYSWVRYYDDAVLLDTRGNVHNSVSGIAWSDDWSESSSYVDGGYASASAYSQSGGQIGTIDPNSGYYPETQGGYAPPVAYGPPAGQNTYYQQGCASACPPQYYGQGGGYQQQGGYQQSGSYYQGGGGYYAGGATTTTVVIQSPPMITTTIIEEEIVTEEVVTTRYTAPRRVVRRAAPVRKAKPRPARRQCGCQCVCR